MEDNKEVKLIEWEMDEVLGELRRISLVSDPAVEVDFMLFSSELKFQTIDKEKRVVTGVAMIPDMKIPRRDDNGGLYYGFFSKETVEKAAQIFFKKGSNTNNTNLEHEFEVDGVNFYESWIVKNPNMDKAKDLGFSVPEGTWMVSAKIDNDVIWENYIKTGLIRGFSVEIKAKESEVELIKNQIENTNGSYMDFVDSMKYIQIEKIAETLGLSLEISALRMPITTLQAEIKDDLLHYIIRETHRDYESISQAYNCMRRSMKKRTTLLTVPHSQRSYGSKRAARGKLHFNDQKLKSISVKYKTTKLYPNEIDPGDVSIAKCEDRFTVKGEELADYRFSETPSSPQFFLYSLASPENAVLWHGIGAFAAPKLLQSYVSIRESCRIGQPVRNLDQKYGLWMEIPLQLNLIPEHMWIHPVYRNIDSSIGCVEKIEDLTRRGMKIEKLALYA